MWRRPAGLEKCLIQVDVGDERKLLLMRGKEHKERSGKVK